ncbi:MAG: PQQ-like beta-propeller repeat protein [Planctomycetaceae bacterium]|jgi:outer membrane protein assembly factor BamB|nr:PQQ-like beta-propeller repeat protein [Planctomycetaceae bacterium]MBT6156804.1 PQQ-like beta-propeller repeat protein [Planctomycetaceae bacterium]MBT6487759.1 PQQ-like beta-propeller repeat protein [Planctomycetaceae bacterium]MBT6496594.1 PQQ-like beta-propeller repeat protein [Planctomycetaceae bacterium]
MSLRTITTAVCFSALFLSASDAVQAQRAGFTPQVPSQRLLGRYGLERAWWGQATLNPTRDKVRHMTVDEENVYVQATSGVVTAFDNETGKRLWAVQLGRRDLASYPLASNEDFALVAVGMQLFALDKFSGELLWELKLPAHPSTSPAMDERNVYIGALDGSVYAFSLRKIHQLYDENLLPQWSHDALIWRYKTAKEITTPPISTGRVVEFASMDRSLYSVSTERREQIFQFETDAPISAPMVRSDGRLYMASEDFNFYCLNSENGSVIWEFVSGLPVRKAPVVIGPHVFLLPDRGGMYCLSKASGKQIWWRPRGTEFIAATTELIFMSDALGNVVLVDRKDGAPVGALPLRDFKMRLSNDRTDRIFLATQSGLVISIRDKNREFPLYHKHPERRPILPSFADDSAPATPAKPPAAGIAP